MTTNNMTAETGLNQILNEIAKVDELVEAFNGYIQKDSLKNCEQIEKLFTMLTNIVIRLNDEQLSMSIKIILKVASTQTVSVRQKVFLNMLQKLVQKHGVSSRLMCECIINSEYLVYTNSEFWIECFHIIKSILATVDYKGVREIMKGCFEKVVAMPKALPASVLPQFLALEEVIRYIFDREACLLPGYFVINEILKVYNENKGWPHWKLGCLVSNFVESFRGAAQMTTMIGHSSMLPVVEHSGYGDHLITPWKLDPNTLKLSLKGNIPYPKQLLLPQTKLLRYVLEQPYSRDMVCSMLGLQKMNKQRCIVLEEQLVELIIRSMEKSDKEVTEGTDPEENHWLWLHISSQLIYFILFQFSVFPNIVNALHEKLLKKDLHRSRDRLMWVLLQYISGSIQRNSLENILPVLKLYDLLYPEKEPLPVPDTSNALCTHQMAVTCIWIHLLRKALMDNIKFHRPIPLALKAHHDYLQMLVQPSNSALCMGSDYRVPLLCNAFSTNNECLSRPMAALVDAVLGSSSNRGISGVTSNTQQSTQSPVITPAVGGTSPVASVPGSGGTTSPISGNASSSNAMGPTTPLSMAVLDSLTIHAKMSLIHSIVTHVLKLAQSKSNLALAPALAETYSRLLVYTEIESLGIKGFISQVLPTVFKSHAWGILYTLLEMFSYRMHHIQPHYRVQLLSHLHSLAAVPQTNQTQLHLCVESTALRLITGLGSNEVQPQLSRFLSEPKTLVSAECEELNRALVLTLARSMHITGTSASQEGSWCKELLTTIMANTPHTWAPHTLQCFPPALADFFVHNPITKENKQQLKKAVEEEYRNWASMTNENDIIAHFSVPTAHPLFLCLLWKMIIETDRINPIAYKILERIGARALSAHLRKFCDYLVFKFAVSEEGQHVNKCVDAINSMIWKYNIVTIDRLVLCLALRTQEGSEAQVCFFIIQLLLFKGAEFRARVCEFVKENSPEHWKQSNWHDKHLAFHRKYPEKFAPEGILDPASYQPLPVYFGNVCLRFLPVFDIVIHRYLELPPVTKSLETLLDHLGCLYKFHDRPVTYLYNTLHYYESKLRDRPSLKRKLVYAVLGSLCETRGCWTLSEAYQRYNIQTPTSTNANSMGTSTDVTVTPAVAPIWVPDLEYYVMLVKRITDTMNGNVKFPNIDWRFNEFPNPAVYALYMTCAELMALPLTPASVANSLLDVVMQRYTEIPSHEIHCWINSIGLIMSSMPEPFWVTLQDRIMQMMQSPGLATWKYAHTPFQLFNFDLAHSCMLDNRFIYMLALAHATWHHAGVGHIASIPPFVKEKLGPSVYSEEQFIFLCHLVAPFLSRYNLDKPSPSIVDITVELFNALERMDKHVQTLRYMDPICDLLYHIKYQYVGNLMKTEVEEIVYRLRLPLQKKLRFITQLSLAEVEAMNQPSADPVVITNGTNGTATPQNTNTASVPQ
ncbi:mediator of RNA polymerase II transcription subunit 23-like [Aphis gossypii]|uniref:mediator of RNA polymerase II transcription subunit 23-like n=1 Tax=Aphis gossypii TaxID=80765 RepID=UPI002158FA5D|nr:mediator of RNA polymerase II transcription subunit 23-like [Aphis gossypii]XP_050057826.1 mediator of RNA polymerase II transcription subunit 23-like [Aphis gossypii]XP_050057827.1 mediator of RNA polymerase II transcription subunit 23-like [Aphis gossypii]